VSYLGNGGRSQTQAISGESMLYQVRAGAKSDLAVKLPETATNVSLMVTSTAFGQGGAIPALYSSYDQNASPAPSLDRRIPRYAILRDPGRGPRRKHDALTGGSLGRMECSRWGHRIAGRTRESGPARRSHGLTARPEHGRR